MFTAEGDLADGMLPAFINFVNQKGLTLLLLEVGVYFGIEVTLLLEVVQKISLALFNQIRVNRCLFVNRNQLFLLPIREKRDPREFRTRNTDEYLGASIHIDHDVSATRVGVVLGRIHSDLARRMMLLAERRF